MILAGDIGGTKTNLALFDEKEPGLPQQLLTYRSGEYPDLQTIVSDYLKKVGAKPQRACFAVAGPVVDGVCKVTNLPWIVSANELVKATAIPEIFLLNDLEAAAFALDILEKDQLLTLHPGDKKEGNRAVISPGTGLGEAGILWRKKRYLPFASEGGHCDFAPTTPLQAEFATFLQSKVGHVSYDRILSGSGFFNLYSFLLSKGREEPSWLKEEMAASDKAATITKNALTGASQLCLEVLDLYLEILGQEAGNCALKFMAIGGVYLGGGIPPKILPRLQSGPSFLEGWGNKGRFGPFLEKIPVFVILDDKASLKGAAAYHN